MPTQSLLQPHGNLTRLKLLLSVPAQIVGMLHLCFLLSIPLFPYFHHQHHHLVSAATTSPLTGPHSAPFLPPNPLPPAPPIGPDRRIKCYAELGRPDPTSCRRALELISAIPFPNIIRHFTPNPVPGMLTSKVPVAFRGKRPEGRLFPFPAFSLRV